MAKRYLEDTILADTDCQSLGCESWYIFTRMMISADDFGVLPGEIDHLMNVLQLSTISRENLSKKLPIILSELSQKSLIFEAQYNEKQVLFFNPDTWDRIQNHLVRHRTHSKYLHTDKIESEKLLRTFLEHSRSRARQATVCITTHKIKREKNSRPKSTDPTVPTKREQSPENAVSSAEVGFSTCPESESVTQPPETGVEPRAETIPEEVIAILHRFGRRHGIEAYRNISASHWVPDLRKIAVGDGRGLVGIGYRCLLIQADRFVTWATGQIEEGKFKTTRGAPNPRSRFLNNWLKRTFPRDYTTGDTDTSWPDDNANYQPLY